MERILQTWVEWATEVAEVRAHFVAIVPVTPAGAHHEHQTKCYDCRDDKEPVLHGS
jgi:hypothetical protein